jgi:hypothetical protein
VADSSEELDALNTRLDRPETAYSPPLARSLERATELVRPTAYSKFAGAGFAAVVVVVVVVAVQLVYLQKGEPGEKWCRGRRRGRRVGLEWE